MPGLVADNNNYRNRPHRSSSFQNRACGKMPWNRLELIGAMDIAPRISLFSFKVVSAVAVEERFCATVSPVISWRARVHPLLRPPLASRVPAAQFA